MLLAYTSTSSGTSPTQSTKVGEGRARAIAQQRVPGAQVTETELEHEHGRAVWEVELVKQHREYEVTIDAITGTVMRVDSDTGLDDHD